MAENKSLPRWTNVMLICDVLVTFWDIGLATYNFVQGRWIAGVLVAAAACLVVWAASGLLQSKHDAQRMRMRHEYITSVLEEMRSRTEFVSEEENPYER